jgi:hypothetical protein
MYIDVMQGKGSEPWKLGMHRFIRDGWGPVGDGFPHMGFIMLPCPREDVVRERLPYLPPGFIRMFRG